LCAMKKQQCGSYCINLWGWNIITGPESSGARRGRSVCLVVQSVLGSRLEIYECSWCTLKSPHQRSTVDLLHIVPRHALTDTDLGPDSGTKQPPHMPDTFLQGRQLRSAPIPTVHPLADLTKAGTGALPFRTADLAVSSARTGLRRIREQGSVVLRA